MAAQMMPKGRDAKPLKAWKLARQAALRMLDAVLRRGQTMDNAAAGGARTCRRPTRRWPARSPARRLRRLPDLDALIDGATRQQLPDDSKARMVLRLALAQKIGLGTPDHALVATALPLVDGGPRRLVHGVLGTLLRKGLPPIDAPRLPEAVEQRWRGAWGEEVVHGGAPRHRPAPAARPQLCQRRGLRKPFRAKACRSRRAIAGSTMRGAVTELPGFGRGPMVGAGPRRLASRAADSRGRQATCSTPAPRRAARRCSWPPPAMR